MRNYGLEPLIGSTKELLLRRESTVGYCWPEPGSGESVGSALSKTNRFSDRPRERGARLQEERPRPRENGATGRDGGTRGKSGPETSSNIAIF